MTEAEEDGRSDFAGSPGLGASRSSGLVMANRFDKRAMGHPLPGRDADSSRPSLASFQDDIAERGKRTRAASATSATTSSAVDTLIEKVQELGVDDAYAAADDGDARTLEVSL